MKPTIRDDYQEAMGETVHHASKTEVMIPRLCKTGIVSNETRTWPLRLSSRRSLSASPSSRDRRDIQDLRATSRQLEDHRRYGAFLTVPSRSPSEARPALGLRAPSSAPGSRSSSRRRPYDWSPDQYYSLPGSRSSSRVRSIQDHQERRNSHRLPDPSFTRKAFIFSTPSTNGTPSNLPAFCLSY